MNFWFVNLLAVFILSCPGKTYTMFGDQAGLAPPPAQPTPTPAASAGSTVAVAPVSSAAANDLAKHDNSTSDAPTAAGNGGSKGTGASGEREGVADSSDLPPLVSPMRGAGAGAARKIKSSSGSRSPFDDDEGEGEELGGGDSGAVKKKISYEDDTGDAAAAPPDVVQEAPASDQPAVAAGAGAAEAAAAGAAANGGGATGGGVAGSTAAPAAKKEDSVKPLKRGAAARGVVPRAAEEVLLAVALKRKLGIDAEVMSMYTHTHI